MQLIHAALLATALLACASPDQEACGNLATRAGAITYGAPDAGANVDGLVRFILPVETQSDDGWAHTCTGTRIAPGTLVTAQHCVRDLKPEEVRVVLPGSASPCEAPPSAPVLVMATHPSLDLALLRFPDEDAPTSIEVASSPPTDAAAPLLLAGYGLTEEDETGALRALPATLLELQGPLLVVQGQRGGACMGDSGGPLFIMEPQPLLFGALNKGSASCLGRDYYLDLSQTRPWIDEVQASPAFRTPAE